VKLTQWLSGTAFVFGCLVAGSALRKAPVAKAQIQGQAQEPAGSINEDGSDWLRSTIGLRVAPVPLNIGNRDSALVGLGSYLVNVAGACADCHANPTYAPGHNPYLGQPKQINADAYLAGGHPFPADNGETVVPPNITPDANGKPAGLTYRKFLLALRYGQDPDNPKRILQVMPWPSYQNLTDRDLRAIYEYLSTIPSIKSAQ
jgi:cytochrome c553